jgi:adenylyltransferase/sulfurtransferase
MAEYQNLTTRDVFEKLTRGDTFLFIDVREPEEHAIANLDGAQLMPLSRASLWIDTLPRDVDIVFFCHHGMRSQHIASFLAEQRGYARVANMLGGIEDWAQRIDPSVPRY